MCGSHRDSRVWRNPNRSGCFHPTEGASQVRSGPRRAHSEGGRRGFGPHLGQGRQPEPGAGGGERGRGSGGRFARPPCVSVPRRVAPEARPSWSPRGGPPSLSGAGSRRQPRFRSRPGGRCTPDSLAQVGWLLPNAQRPLPAGLPQGPVRPAPRSASHGYPGTPACTPAPDPRRKVQCAPQRLPSLPGNPRPEPHPGPPTPGPHSRAPSGCAATACAGPARAADGGPGGRGASAPLRRQQRATSGQVGVARGRPGHCCPAAPRPPPREPE